MQVLGLVLGAAVGLVVPDIAVAQTSREHVALAEAIGVGQDGKSCFSRTYDNAHMAAHPDQLVKSMSLLIQRDNRSYPGYLATLSVTLRGRSQVFHQGVFCPDWNSNAEARNRGAALICTVECDGGGFVIQKSSSANAIRLRLDYLGRGIAMSSSCDGDRRGGIDLEAGKDDKEFRLDRSASSDCRNLDR